MSSIGLKLKRLNEGARLQMTLPSSVCSGICSGTAAGSSTHSITEPAEPPRAKSATPFPKFVTYVDKQMLPAPADAVADLFV